MTGAMTIWRDKCLVKVVHNIETIVLNIPRAAPFTAKNKLRS